ncbi:MAG: FG-GAP-like repeat-containing protein [bacterium]
MLKRFYGYCFFLIFFICILHTSVFSQPQFIRHNIDNDLRGAYWVYAVDMDKDGDLDLVTASHSGLDWWRNSSGAFSKRVVGSFRGAWAVFAADADKDGDVDVMGASSGVDEFGFWKNNGGFNFSKILLGSATGAESVHAADLDGDGDLDILGAVWSEDLILWFKNDGSGRFTRKVMDGNLRNAHSVYAADLDKDGDIDGIASGVGGTIWYRNDGQGNFTKKTIHSIGGWSVFAADVDGDGDKDVLRTQRDNGDVVLFKNSGSGSFSRQVIEQGYGECWSIVAGDVDGDGDLDIAGAGFAANNLKVWLNNGNGNFGQGVVVANVSMPRSVYIADLDKDGDGDIAAAIRGARDLAWFEVKGSAPAPTPKTIAVTQPNGGENLLSGSDFRIEWDSTGNIDNVKIEYTINDGGSWSTITNSTNNDGAYLWSVPSVVTNQARIRITNVDNNSLKDLSNSTFSISSATVPTLTFTDITQAAGTGGPEGSNTGGHSAIFSDVNSDNRPDLYITMLFTGEKEDLFFINNGGNVFSNEANLRGVSDRDGGSHGATFADLDNDGDFDLYNGTTFGSSATSGINNIYRNNGSGFFVDVTAASGIPQREWPTRGVVAFDMDTDGDLDLLAITNYQGTDDPPDERNELYRNDGNLQFTAVNSGDLYTARAGQGATDTDFDGDGDIDILAANRTGDVNILRNDGNGNFTIVAPASIGIFHRAGDGITMGDIDYDGDLDMFLVSAPNGTLYRNNGNGTFAFVSSFANGDGYMGGFADLDNDGDLDLLFAGDTKCYLNDGTGNFTVGPSVPVTGINDPRSISFADIDNDGDLDFAFGCKRSRNWLVRNNYNGGNWLKVKLISPFGQAGAFGAKVYIYSPGQTAGVPAGFRESRSSNGYLGENDQVLHFGLGSRPSVDVVVKFLNGTTTTRTNIAANQTITIDMSGTAPQLPVINSFNPVSGPVGTEVTILGSNFIGTSEVAFNGQAAVEVFVDSDSQIRAKVPAGATTGKIRVTNAAGGRTSAADFTVPTGGGVITSTFISSDDSYVRSSRPNENNGPSPSLRVRKTSSVDRHSYLKFNVTGLTGAVQSAKLRLFVTDASRDGGTVYTVSNNYLNTTTPWTEDGLVWVNAPTISGQSLASIGGANLNQTVEVDVTSVVNGNGIYSFALKNSSSDIVIYSSKEGPVAPQLVVESQDNSAPVPVITAINPTSGVIGSGVTITGNRFTGVNAVTFNGTPAAVFTIFSDTQIIAEVPVGATTGPITVTNADGSDTSTQTFTVLLPPLITSFTPTNGPVGTTVTVTGNHFNGAAQVSFNGTLATSFTIISNNELRAVVPSGATTGKIRVANNAGTGSSNADFTVTFVPQITSFTPNSGAVGTSVTISGFNFTSTFDVAFNGVTAPGFTMVSNTEIRATVPVGATTGKISITNLDGTGSSTSDFQVIVPPIIASFSPTAGVVGSEVTVTGTNLNGVNQVGFNGTPVTNFTLDSNSQLRATVPNGATTGPITVSNSAGSVTSLGDFTVLNGPSTFTLFPIEDAFIRSNRDTRNYGNSVELRVRHTNADHNTYLKFNVTGLSSPPQSAKLKLHVIDPSDDGGSFYLVSNEYLNTTTSWTEEGLIAKNAPTITGTPLTSIGAVSLNQTVEIDLVSVVRGNGIYSFAIKNNSSDAAKYSSKEGVVSPELVIAANGGSPNSPTISSFTPVAGVIGTNVTISGSNFNGTTNVAFNGISTAVFSVVSNSEIHATVPASATTGKISVTTSNGTAQSVDHFTVILPPEITSFSPIAGPPGTQVDIQGNHFTGVTGVEFNGQAAASISVVSANLLRAIVPVGATTGKITVTSSAGSGASLNDFTITGATGNLTFTPIHDAFIRSSRPTKNYGDNLELRVRKTSSADVIAYLKFNIAGVAGPLVSAKLRLFVIDASVEGGSIHLASNNYLNTSTPWIEDGLNTNNAPEINATVLSSLNGVNLNEFVEFDVTSAITGDGIYTFAIKNKSSDVAKYSSKEGVNASQLILETGGGSGNAPTITAFAPASGVSGTEVTISGTNFTAGSNVSFNNVPATVFTVVSSSQILANVPAGATTGKIRVSNSDGTGTSSTDFLVVLPPTITAFTPQEGAVGTSVTVTGTNFDGVTEVAFNGVAASNWNVDSETQLRAVVPSGATTGKISLTNAAGSATSSLDFTVTAPPSSLTFNPIHDSFVRSNRQSNNYGHYLELRVRQPHSDFIIAYLKFDVQGIGSSVLSAKIKLHVIDASVDGGGIYSVSNNFKDSNTPWTEEALVYTNAPLVSGSPLSTQAAINLGETVEFDVTAAINGDGIYSFAIKNARNDVAKYSSKEGVAIPELVINTGSAIASFTEEKPQWEATEMLAANEQINLPETLILSPNYPNPFNIETNIEYGLPAESHVRLVIFNIRGRVVRTLVDEVQTPGFKKVRWNGTDANGVEVSSGVYFVRLQWQNQKMLRKITLQK